jgi:hypothetical protein
MSTENLIIYLNDHLAGSVAAVELIDHLIETAEASPPDRQFFKTLKADVEADQAILRQVLARFGGEEKALRKAAAWLAEKLARAKLLLDGGGADAAMGRLQALEALRLGISGKKALWQSLAASGVPLTPVDLPELTRRAEEQCARVEAKRLEAATAALG